MIGQRTGTLIAVVTLLTVAVPATGRPDAEFKVWEERDEFKPGIVVVNSSAIRIKAVKFTSHWFAHLQAKYIYDEESRRGSYYLDVIYHGNEWMLWDELSLKLPSGEVFSVGTAGQPRRDASASGVEEHIRFRVPAEAFGAITEVENVDMRLNGKYYYDFHLNSIGTTNLGKLAEAVAEKELITDERVVTEGSGRSSGGAGTPNYIEELRELAKLRDEGVITEEEFDAKKRQLLDLPETMDSADDPKSEAPDA